MRRSFIAVGRPEWRADQDLDVGTQAARLGGRPRSPGASGCCREQHDTVAHDRQVPAHPRSSAVAQALVLEPLDCPIIPTSEGALLLLVVVEAAGVRALRVVARAWVIIATAK